MNTYEATMIFVSDENQLREAKEFVKKEFESSGLTITKEEDMGDRLLSYPVRKNDRGHYMVFTFQGPSEPLKNLNKSLKLRPEILKFLFTRQGA
jgi:small subunit ribosomal protein S6